MQVVAKFTCPNDGETFQKDWRLYSDVACPRCGVIWKARVTTSGAELTEDTGRREPPTIVTEP